jgi:hypothetical protein
MVIHDELGKIQWRKSTWSDSTQGGCVSIALVGNVIAVRDSKDVNGPVITLSRKALQAFILATKAGVHDPATSTLDRDGEDVAVRSDTLAGGDGSRVIVTQDPTITCQGIGEPRLRLGILSSGPHVE